MLFWLEIILQHHFRCKHDTKSRRHCVIINTKDNVWLYDLESTGTEINDVAVTNKVPLIGYNNLKINDIYFALTTDKSKLI